MPERDDEPSIEKIADELDVVLNNPTNLKTLLLDADERISNLRRIAEKLEPQIWNNNRVAALKQVIARAILALPDRDDVFHLSKEMPTAKVAFWLFNIGAPMYKLKEQQLEGVSGKGYPHLRDQLKHAGGLTGSSATMWRGIRMLRVRLAGELFGLQEASEKQLSPFTLYVDRPQIHEAYNQADNKLIVFYGLAGMGKTWLTQEIVRLADGSPAPIINVTKDGVYLPDVQSAISQFKIDISRAVSPDLRSFITLLLTDENAPDHVLFDGLESTDELKHLLPTLPTNSVVVATCRIKGEYPLELCTYIRVDRFSEDEGAGMIKRRLPSLTAEEAASLAHYTEGYPLLLHYVPVLLAELACSIEDFCREMIRDSGATAANMPTGDGRKLLAVLDKLVGRIWEKNLDAFKLLAALTYRGAYKGRAHRFVLERFLAACHGGRTSVLRTAQAIRVLRDMAIIDSIDSDYLAMHIITAKVVRALLRKNIYASDLSTTIIPLMRHQRSFTVASSAPMNGFTALAYYAPQPLHQIAKRYPGIGSLDYHFAGLRVVQHVPDLRGDAAHHHPAERHADEPAGQAVAVQPDRDSCADAKCRVRGVCDDGELAIHRQ